jgi:glycosyltransferase involved in cell wall biosynthesis
MPEMLGDAGLYFDPTNASDVAGALRQLSGNASLRVALATRAFERARHLSWAQCADETFRFVSAFLP